MVALNLISVDDPAPAPTAPLLRLLPPPRNRRARLHSITIIAVKRFPAALLLRHRAARRQHITQRINRLYQLRDKMDHHLRNVLIKKQQGSITAGDFVVAIERSRYARRCRVIVGPDGTRHLLEPGHPSVLTVKKKPPK